MRSKIVSIQIGKVVTVGDKNSDQFLKKEYTTASYKNRVDGRVDVTKLSIVGDSVADTIHHGGVDKAIFVNSIHNYDSWKKFLAKDELPPAALGENLTVDGMDESTVCIGDIYQIGGVKVQVSQPRQPCWKISRRWEHNDFMQEIYTSGRTGWYFRVLEEGSFKAGDEIKLISQIDDKINILDANKVLRDPSSDIALANRLLKIDILANAWYSSLKAKIDRL